MGYIPKAMHRKAKRDGRSVKQPTHSTSKSSDNEDHFRLPSLGRSPEIGSEAQVEGGNYDKVRGPENLFPPSLENAPKDNNASYGAEQTYYGIQQNQDQPANKLASRPSSAHQILY
jgi:hypothetical protein